MRPNVGTIILLVEDDELVNRAILRRFKDQAHILIADTENQAWTLYQVYQNAISLILLDGMLRRSNSLKLLGRIRDSGFKGRVVSTTSLPEMRKIMFPIATEGEPDQPRCDEHVEKSNLADFISDHIGKC